VKAFMVAGLGFGDEGKGSVVDWLVRRHGASTVVRYNGGPQAAHHVVTADGRSHCASQLGAGVLVPSVRGHLARSVAVDPLALLAEDEALRAIGVEDGLARLTVDPRCVVVTPMHAAMNRIQELARGARRHGSCGRGVGQAVLDAERGFVPSLRMGDLVDPDKVLAIVRQIRIAKLDRADQICDEHPDDLELHALRERELKDPARDGEVARRFHELLSKAKALLARPTASDLGEAVVLEGAQGVLLDRHHGFWPYVTPSVTTFDEAERFLFDAAWTGAVSRVGVLRAYATRHGAGPMVTEDEALTLALPERHNRLDPWQGRFRAGWFDGPVARYAIEAASGLDALVVTHLDRLARAPAIRVCPEYDRGRHLPDFHKDERTSWWSACTPRYADLPDADAFIPWVEAALGRRVTAVSRGPTAEDKAMLTREPL
jgi:adenylosuccinate synthase